MAEVQKPELDQSLADTLASDVRAGKGLHKAITDRGGNVLETTTWLRKHHRSQLRDAKAEARRLKEAAR